MSKKQATGGSVATSPGDKIKSSKAHKPSNMGIGSGGSASRGKDNGKGKGC